MKFTRKITSLYDKLERLAEEMNEHLEELEGKYDVLCCKLVELDEDKDKESCRKLEKQIEKLNEQMEEVEEAKNEVENAASYLMDYTSY